ncbi:MAG: hypothetical protein NTZ33_04050 [Bacteroidetes bacterium]|nr:hypothetical protein [Bacteroidota bacterium]
MKTSFHLFFLLFFTFQIFAANENTCNGGRSAAMGGASVTLADFWAINNNQAGIANIKNAKAGIYFENRFLLKELSYKSLAFLYPTQSGILGFNYHQFGYNAYKEQKIGLSYARSFSKNFSAGLQLDYMNTALGDNYGSKSAFTFELGVLAKIAPNLMLAAHIFNPVNARFNDYNNEKIPSVFKLGLSYLLSEKLIIAIESEKNINFDAVFKAGFEYKILEFAYARIGISTNPTINTFGFGIEYHQFTIDFASSIHQTLGYSPQFSLIYNFK